MINVLAFKTKPSSILLELGVLLQQHMLPSIYGQKSGTTISIKFWSVFESFQKFFTIIT